MLKLRRIRRRLAIIIAIFLLLDVAAAVYLSTLPSATMREQSYVSTQNELQVKLKESQPLRGMENKLKLADQEIAAFYRDRFPSQRSAIPAELGKLAARNGVRISQAKYEEKDAGLAGLTRVNIESNLEGDYRQVVKFINALERDRLFFILNGIDLGNQQGGFVRLGLKLETYLREQS
jgi:type IV pilus assembly protein PilO